MGGGVGARLGVGGVGSVGGEGGGFGVFGYVAGDVDDGGRFDGGGVLFGCGLHAFRPLASWGVGAKQDQECGDADDQDARDYKGDSPCNVWSEALLGDERIVDGRHSEVGDAATCISKAGGDGVGGADYVLVEETRGPYLARYKTTAQDSDEEPKSVQLVDVVCCA